MKAGPRGSAFVVVHSGGPISGLRLALFSLQAAAQPECAASPIARTATASRAIGDMHQVRVLEHELCIGYSLRPPPADEGGTKCRRDGIAAACCRGVRGRMVSGRVIPGVARRCWSGDTDTDVPELVLAGAVFNRMSPCMPAPSTDSSAFRARLDRPRACPAPFHVRGVPGPRPGPGEVHGLFGVDRM